MYNNIYIHEITLQVLKGATTAMSIFDFFKKKNEVTPRVNMEQKIEIPVHRGVTTSTKIDLDSSNVNIIRNCFIAFDVETTGLSPITDRIVELGAVIFLNGKVNKTFSSLVNPEIPISQSASAVNHITNAMLATAPSEKEIYPKLIEFLGEALHGNIVMCAHNARFDFDFLCNTLSRLGFDANIQYADTLHIARKYLHGLENYKQCSIEAYFGLTNAASHRAVSDAENCGHILFRLLDSAEESFEAERRQVEQSRPMPQELEVCAYIQMLIAKQGGETKLLRYKRNSSGYVDVCCLYSFLKIKFSKKGNYILVKKDCVSIADYVTEPCTQSEGGTDFVRVFFSSPFDLESLSKYIYDAYLNCQKSMEEYASHYSYTREEIENIIRLMCALTDEEVSLLLKTASERDYTPITASTTDKVQISRDDVVINAVHSRVPMCEIKNIGNWDKGFTMGFPYWEKGEEARKAGQFDKAIELFDKARQNGYAAPALYNSYAVTYRQQKDYSNEIVILDEGISRMPEQASQWEARRDKSMKLLFTQQDNNRKALEKAKQKAEKLAQKEAESTQSKQPRGRAIIQMDDDGRIIKEFETIAAAVQEIGISSKSIRDAANGIQKHAGGFRWMYKE